MWKCGKLNQPHTLSCSGDVDNLWKVFHNLSTFPHSEKVIHKVVPAVHRLSTGYPQVIHKFGILSVQSAKNTHQSFFCQLSL